MRRALPGFLLATVIAGGLVGAALTAGAGAQGETLQHRLSVPMVARDVPLPETYFTRPGDTLAIVATLFGTSVNVLQTLNDLPAEGELLPGTRVFAPTPTPPPAILPCEDVLNPVSKTHALPDDCTPYGLEQLPFSRTYGGPHFVDPRSADAFDELATAAEAAGHDLKVRSAYRSYDEQVTTFAFWVQQLGYEEALRVSAPPGHSEHQLGTTVDVTTAEVGFELTTAFGATAAGQWLEANAWRHGFVISYPAGTEATTGYAYEPWHIRWVGGPAAAAVHQQGVTLYAYLLDTWLPGRYLFDW